MSSTRFAIASLLAVIVVVSVGASISAIEQAAPGVGSKAIADEMITLPAGSFMMGSPDGEAQRQPDEGPQHRVHVARFAIAKYPVTRAQWKAFVAATHRPPPPDDCFVWRDAQWTRSGSYLRPGFSQSDRDPVVCVSWRDAQDYLQWVSAQTGKRYRLPSEAEWEYAARAGSRSAYYWGDSFDPVRVSNNHKQTEPVGAHPPNAFGLYDILGNAWDWTADCYHDSYVDAPTDGSAWTADGCKERVFRGGSWYNTPAALRVANRAWDGDMYRFFDLGFSIAESL